MPSAALGDEKYLGTVAGMLAALHTWGKMLVAHPHLHVIVTFGGLAADGTWRTPKKSCLLPRKVLMQVYRRNFRRLLLSALDKGELVLPPSITPTAVKNLMNKLNHYRIDWYTFALKCERLRPTGNASA